MIVILNKRMIVKPKRMATVMEDHQRRKRKLPKRKRKLQQRNLLPHHHLLPVVAPAGMLTEVSDSNGANNRLLR
jgi:hypothetical protein